MKQVSQNYKTGAIRVENVPVPALRRGGILVRTAYSVISSGTEGMKVREGKMSYLEKARARPDQVKKVLRAVRQQGILAAYQKVMNRLDSLTPLGYSTAGVVIAVGQGAEEFHVGQRVACAGAGYANHAEINFVPKNLAVAVPDQLSLQHAAFATVGAIALQGLRQGGLQLGETACVVGLGLLGQLLVQLLRAGGVSVLGVDLLDERCRLAEEFGAAVALNPSDPSLHDQVQRFSGGRGVDCVFIAAGGKSNEPATLAVALARDRGRVVDIGKTRLDLDWNDCYLKELDLRFSRSYGPGRYDPTYEEMGIDYPIGYVRWTERRNMSAFLDLVASGKLSVSRLIEDVLPFDSAEVVYEELANGKGSGLGCVFQHADVENEPRRIFAPSPQPSAPRGGRAREAARIGVIGAGNYASTMLLPHLAQDPKVELIEVATATSLSAANAMRKFGFLRGGTDYNAILSAEDIDAVLIATQHSSHSMLAEKAIRAGKSVYVEKPLAIDLDGLRTVWDAVQETGNQKLTVGFNRRFAPFIVRAKEIVNRPKLPLVISYRVHAGRLEAGSWYLDADRQGSRFNGEAGHFFDVLTYIAGAAPVSVFAKSLRPLNPSFDDLTNMAVTVDYENGSLGTLLYLTQGSASLPKEQLEVFGGGIAVQLDNFERLTVYEGDASKKVTNATVDKGQRAEMSAFAAAVADQAPTPIPLDGIFYATLATLAAEESMRSGKVVFLRDYWDTSRQAGAADHSAHGGF